MARAGIQWKNLDKFRNRATKLADAQVNTKAAARSTFRRASKVLALSQELVPVDDGDLRRSGDVELPAIDSQGVVSVDISYGGASAAYAVIVHEDLSAFHKPPTQAKYLEEPFLAEQRGTLADLSNEVRSRIRG